MQNQQDATPDIAALEAAAMRAAQTGREEEAAALWRQILALDPNHRRTLAALGQRAFRQGDMQSARDGVPAPRRRRGADPQEWIHLALACRNLDDEQAEQEAIRSAR